MVKKKREVVKKRMLEEKGDTSITLKTVINLHACKVNQKPKVRILLKVKVLSQASKH